MSHLKLKQLAGPSNGARGGIIVFENATAKWSTDLTSSLQLPSGNTGARPQDAANGAIRYNSTTKRVEALEDGSWVNLSGAGSFESLTDGPGTLSGQAGKSVRVNSEATGLEYFVPPTGLTKFRFKVNFVGQNPSSVSEVPNGWNVTVANTDINVIHNLGSIPAFVTTFGVYALDSNQYVQRISGTGSGGGIGLRYNINTSGSACVVTGITTNSTGSPINTHAYVDTYFLLS